MEPIRAWDMADPNGKDVTRVMLFDRDTGEWTDITAFVLSMEITMHDHYPLQHLPQCARCGEHEQPGMLHICAEAILQMTTQSAPSPFVPQPAPPAPNRFVKWGDSMVCTVCQLDARYCRGHAPSPSPPPPPGGDGDASDLNRRVRELRGRDNR